MENQEPFEYIATIEKITPKKDVKLTVADFVTLVIAGKKDEALQSFDVTFRKPVDTRSDEEIEKELFKANMRKKRTRKQSEAEAEVVEETQPEVNK